MFPNLKAEMARKGIKPTDIAKLLKVTYDTAINKLSGKTEFTRAEIFKIRKEFFPDLALEYLFKSNEDLAEEAV